MSMSVLSVMLFCPSDDVQNMGHPMSFRSVKFLWEFVLEKKILVHDLDFWGVSYDITLWRRLIYVANPT